DEAPALTGWVHEKYGRFGREFYGRLFELLLRLRANYLWPAMWLPRAFNDDDPENPRLADEYGIVMGTSHHEPLMRAHAEWGKYGQGPWDYSKNDAVLREFWRGGVERTKNFESIVTLGMRGDGDEAMTADTNTRLLEGIVADQRRIITEVTGKPAEQTPQLWALYKEVQDYYEAGMRVPDDVILLWCDDNWGNIRRLPTPEERKRPGGAGVYYHFDYVGGPRNYKWINVTPITKVWEQMHLAWQLQANRLWVVNVGDLKPMEFPVEFFLSYAWDPARWPYEKLGEYSRQWAAREFGAEHAAEVALLINGYSKLNRRRTPELLTPDTYSLTNYREAERVLAEWRDLVTRAEKLNATLAPEYRDAFFQLVLYPVKASATVQEVHIASARNALYAEQGRAHSANAAADHARAMSARDAALREQYHTLLGGKWNHLMSEKKFGYTYWQTPPVEVMPALSVVRPMPGAEAGLAIDGSRFAYPRWGLPPPRTPAINVYDRSATWVELFSRGTAPLRYKVTPAVPWLRITPAAGTFTDDVHLQVEADWAQVPLDTTSADFRIEVDAPPELNPPDPATARFSATTRFGQSYSVTVPVVNPAGLRPGDFSGHIETNGHVAIDAPHFSRTVATGGVEWKTLPGFGRTLGGVTAFPVTLPAVTPDGDSPRLEYDLHTFSSGDVKVEVHLAPSLDFQSGEGLRYAISIDDEAPQIVKVGTWAPQANWETAVADSVRRVATTHQLASPGRHTLKFWLVTPGVVLERIVIDTAPAPATPPARGPRPTPGVRPSYLGPPESFRGAASAPPAADQPARRGDRNSQLAHEQLLQKAKAGGISLYFLGDSITRRWGATDYPDFLAHWQKNFHGWNAGNFGWGADGTENMLWRLQNGELDGVNPKVIVLLAGTNNVGKEPGDDAKVADVTRGVAALVSLCREKAPGATIILMGIFPRTDGPVVPTINRINANLAQLADGKTVRYLSINDRLADAQGRLHDGMTVDQLHLSVKGYQVWSDALKPLLTELLGPPAATDTAPPPTGDPSAKR
ncbi:MAG: glycosyl hydrolase 115 family protein, partial [Lacunisphaera sp.]|nr:glycosyl hydrolase 115 family protein [Lacunisphaera sp.]